MRRFMRGAVAGLAVLLLAAGAPADMIDFEDPDHLENNFRKIEGAGSYGDSDNGAGNDYVGVWNDRVSLLYDKTPGDGSTTVTTWQRGAHVEFDTWMDGSKSIGVYVINPDNHTHSYLALFNVGDGATDKVRFSSDANPVASDSTNWGALDGVTGDAGYDADLTPSWQESVHVSVDYSINGLGEPVLVMTAGSLAHGVTLAGMTAHETVEVAVRASPGGADHVWFDNFLATPEPATVALVVLGGAGLMLRRRRR